MDFSAHLSYNYNIKYGLYVQGDLMKTITAEELLGSDIDFDSVELSPASWSETKTFFGYDVIPRPSSALFIVCRDITAVYHL